MLYPYYYMFALYNITSLVIQTFNYWKLFSPAQLYSLEVSRNNMPHAAPHVANKKRHMGEIPNIAKMIDPTHDCPPLILRFACITAIPRFFDGFPNIYPIHTSSTGSGEYHSPTRIVPMDRILLFGLATNSIRFCPTRDKLRRCSTFLSSAFLCEFKKIHFFSAIIILYRRIYRTSKYLIQL